MQPGESSIPKGEGAALSEATSCPKERRNTCASSLFLFYSFSAVLLRAKANLKQVGKMSRKYTLQGSVFFMQSRAV